VAFAGIAASLNRLALQKSVTPRKQKCCARREATACGDASSGNLENEGQSTRSLLRLFPS
jgi:hypothetical protein